MVPRKIFTYKRKIFQNEVYYSLRGPSKRSVTLKPYIKITKSKPFV